MSIDADIGGYPPLTARKLAATQIDEPIDAPDEQAAAEEIAERRDQHIPPGVSPRQRRQGFGFPANERPELCRGMFLHQQGIRENKGVRDRVLKSRGHKRGDRRDDDGDLVDGAARAQCHPDGQADEDVAKDR